MVARTNDPTGFDALPLAGVLTLIICIDFISFMHRWKASEGPVLELHIDVVTFFHLRALHSEAMARAVRSQHSR
jgi:hypothetical protein